ncbi:10978_t:CDS:1, partial [Entrophospora sp. SA101]
VSSKHIKSCRCDVRFISPLGTNLGEREFAVYSFPTKVISDYCKSSRINQTILNGLLSLNLND